VSGIPSWLSAHRTLITTVLLGAGLLVLALVLLSRLVRRAGGAAVVRRRIGREIALTARAFADPVRRWLRHRRRLRHLARLLGDERCWRDAERALDLARTSGAHPYAVLLGHTAVGVLVAAVPNPASPPGKAVAPPPGSWRADADDPRLWWCPRADLGDLTGLAAPVLTAVGLDDAGGEPFAVLLDLCAGPASLVVGGDTTTARVLQRSVAAQLDARLPGGVVVGEGVHPRYAGPSAAEVWSAVRHRAATGALSFAVTADSPASLATSPADGPARLITIGRAHGHAWLITTERLGAATLAGTRLSWDVLCLAPAVARTIGGLPPVIAPTWYTTARADGPVAVSSVALPPLPAPPPPPSPDVPAELEPDLTSLGRSAHAPRPSRPDTVTGTEDTGPEDRTGRYAGSHAEPSATNADEHAGVRSDTRSAVSHSTTAGGKVAGRRGDGGATAVGGRAGTTGHGDEESAGRGGERAADTRRGAPGGDGERRPRGVLGGDFGWDEAHPAPARDPDEEAPPGEDARWGVSAAGGRPEEQHRR
jgi:hypothetical protein